jgi:hypothetical protein
MSEYIKERAERHAVGCATVVFTVLTCDDRVMDLDTSVRVEGELCLVSGRERLDFLRDLHAVVDKYRI